MRVDLDYVDLEFTLRCLRNQVIDSLPYIDRYIPKSIKTPEKLFYYLKDITEYKNDPDGVELLQSVQTLIDFNEHGESGRGDCDCFTILTLASCFYLGFSPLYVRLVGRNKYHPSHIYSLVYDKQRKKVCAMDLTNKEYCHERSYPFKQTLDFMILRLADDSFPLASKASRTAKKQAKQQIKVVRQQSKAAKKTAKVQARATKKANKAQIKVAKSTSKLTRKTARQDRRTDRVTQKGERKALKRQVKVAKKENRLQRVQGRGEMLKVRQGERVKAAQNSDVESPEDVYDQQEAQATDSSITPGAGQYNGEDEEEYDDYELLPDEEDEDEGEEEYYDEDEEGDEVLEDGFLFQAAKGIKKLIDKGKTAASKIQASKAGKAVTKGANYATENKQLKDQIKDLQDQLKSEQNKKLGYSIGSGVTGIVIGYTIKALTK